MTFIQITKKEKVISLFNQGYSPKDMAQKIERISFKRVMDYLYMEVGKGNIKKSDIWFTINHNIRKAVDRYDKAKEGNSEEEEIKALLELANLYMIHEDEAKLFLKLKEARVADGDMYELISEIELLLHRSIKNVLINEHGNTEWWMKGVPQKIRERCENIYKKDSYLAKEPFYYTNFIDLKKIVKALWHQFEKILPIDIVKNKNDFLSKIERLNEIRNGVMHPIKGYQLTPESFDFVYEFHASIKKDKWQEREVTQ